MRLVILLICSVCLAEERTIVFPVTFGAGDRLPSWSAGNLVISGDLLNANEPSLLVYDNKGEKRYALNLVGQGLAGRVVRGYALLPDGSGVVALGRLYQRDGGLAFVNVDGTVRSWFDTGRYQPEQIALAPDGTVWTFGGQSREVPRDEEDPGEYLTVRHYSRDGRLLGSFVPRTTFSRDLPHAGRTGHGIGASFLRVLGTRIAVYSEYSRIYLELDQDGREILRWNVPTLDRVDQLCQLHALASENVVASCVNDFETRHVFRLSPDGWKKLDSMPAGHVIGADADGLALLKDAGARTTVHFFRY